MDIQKGSWVKKTAGVPEIRLHAHRQGGRPIRRRDDVRSDHHHRWFFASPFEIAVSVPTGSDDWIGFFTPGAANNAYITWRYTTGTASGSISFDFYSTLAFGNYELRLFAGGTFNVLATRSFAVAPTVSGLVTDGGSPIAGVSIALDGVPCTTSIVPGGYGCFVPYGWSGSITPSLGGYLFDPASRSVGSITSHTHSLSFATTAALQVSGTISVGASPLAGVALAGANGASCTASNASGQYTCAVPSGWSGSVTPTLAGHTFAPASRSYTSVSAADPGENYAATVVHQVSGTVTVGGSPLGGVPLAATNGVTCPDTNASGQYTCTVPQGWSGTITPSLIHNNFSPASRSYTNVTAAQATQDYASTVIYQVSGSVTLNGVPLADVALAATNGVTCSPSSASGQYNCTVPPGWSGTVTPSATGYSFSPASRNFSSLTDDQAAQGFTATLDTATAPLYFVHVDHLNTPRVIYDDQQQLRWKWEQQEAFGVNAPDENPSSLGAFEFALRFPGQYFDKETNLHYNYFRDYDPSIGRYEQSDPIGLKGGLNTYVYVENSPLSWSDETGEAKGGKQNVSAEGFNKKSDPKQVEKAMKEAKDAGKIKSYRALRGLLKVIKRGGTMGICFGVLDLMLDVEECRENPCNCDDPDVRNIHGCT